MRMLAVATAALVLATSAGDGTAARKPKAFLLVALPSLGSVTWRCGPTDGLYGLGYREFWSSATTTVTLHAGRRTVRKRVDPHQLVTFPFSRAATQHLTFVQMTEPGTLRAVVTVRFAQAPGISPPCQAYLPPPFAVRVSRR
jgi:hypothetical protein